jgi:hypothetical protein
MAVSQVSPTHKYTVSALLKGKQDVVRGNTGRTHHPYDPDIRRVLQTTDPSQVSSGVCSPCTQKTYNLRLKICFTHNLSFFFLSAVLHPLPNPPPRGGGRGGGGFTWP